MKEHVSGTRLAGVAILTQSICATHSTHLPLRHSGAPRIAGRSAMASMTPEARAKWSVLNNFLMDLENSYLSEWDHEQRDNPTGPRRFEDPEWGAMMKRACDAHSDVSWEQYCEWVSDGGGDEWFQAEEAGAASSASSARSFTDEELDNHTREACGNVAARIIRVQKEFKSADLGHMVHWKGEKPKGLKPDKARRVAELFTDKEIDEQIAKFKKPKWEGS